MPITIVRKKRSWTQKIWTGPKRSIRNGARVGAGLAREVPRLSALLNHREGIPPGDERFNAS